MTLTRRADARLTQVLTSPWLLVLVVALGFFWQLGSVALYDLDEGAFTEATREMLASGNFITPHKDGEPRYDKPVLIYWLQAASTSLLGFDEFALRLPSALAATLWVLALWLFVRARLDRRTATVAALAMVLTLQVALIARAAVADALLNLFIALAFFEMYRYFLDPGPQASRHAVLRACLWMGLGFLTKGPVAVFFPVVVSFLFFHVSGAWRRWWQAVFTPMGWLVFALVALPWYVAIYLDDGAGFFRSFFLQHNAGRFTGTMNHHGGGYAYYALMLPLILMPFFGWFLSVLPRLRRSWSDPLERFCWLWFATVFVFFSFSATKLPHYLLYGCTPLFLLMARHRDALVNRWLAFVPPLALFALMLLLPLLVPIAATQAHRADQIAMFALAGSLLDAPYVLLVLAGLVGVLALWRWTSVALWQRLLLVGVVQALVVYGVLVPRVFAVMQQPVKEAAALARSLDRPTVVYRTSMPSFSVYRQAITPARAPEAGDLVFLRVDKLRHLACDFPHLRGQVLYQRGAVALVGMEPGSPVCERSSP